MAMSVDPPTTGSHRSLFEKKDDDSSSSELEEPEIEQILAESIGRAARRARTGLGLTQEDVADRLRINAQFYGRIERGESLPSVPNLYRIAQLLNLNADILIGREPGADNAALCAYWARHRQKPKDSPQLRRIVRQLRRASPATLDLVATVLDRIVGVPQTPKTTTEIPTTAAAPSEGGRMPR